MKFKIWYLLFLLVLAACKDDGSGSTPLFGYYVMNGEATPMANEGVPAAGATVEVYSSAQSWIDGGTSIKTFTTDSKGMYESNESFSSTSVFFAKSGAYNNWPMFLTAQLNSDPNIIGRFTGNSTVFNTLLQNFETVSGKTFLFSDVLVNGVSVFANVDACSKDNYVKLTKDAKIIYNEGVSVCTGKSPSQTYDIQMTMGTKAASEGSVNGAIVWGLAIPWTEVGNMVYIKKDFTQIFFRVNNGNDNVTVYTLQN
ncbi:MAG TPA: hypothetical protein VMV47_17430 [Bacteroidales bacterium]|nr:hypothetical protein [Bacteroidales bacterium]